MGKRKAPPTKPATTPVASPQLAADQVGRATAAAEAAEREAADKAAAEAAERDAADKAAAEAAERDAADKAAVEAAERDAADKAAANPAPAAIDELAELGLVVDGDGLVTLELLVGISGVSFALGPKDPYRCGPAEAVRFVQHAMAIPGRPAA